MVLNATGSLPLCESIGFYDHSEPLDFTHLETNLTEYNDSWLVHSMYSENTENGTIANEVTGMKWFEIVIPIISVIGIVGNILNLILLTRRRLLSSMESLERSATYGLVALALSDMIFCLAIFPHMFITNRTFGNTWINAMELYYRVYGIGFINLFVMVSTWLIMVISVTRYLVVIRPILMRSSLNGTKTVLSIVIVFAVSVLISLPQFMHLKVVRCQTWDDVIMYEIQDNRNEVLVRNVRFYIRWIWPIFADFIPVIVLAFCNARLVMELNRASSVRRRALHSSNAKESGHKVTLTLVIIVLMLLLLVTPPEVLKYINPYKAWGHVGYVVANVANALQALSFAINFFLYVVLNPYFRQTMWDLFCSCCQFKSSDREVTAMNSKYTLNGYSPRTGGRICMTEETFV